MSYENEVATCMKDFLSSNRPIALLAYVFSYYNICYTAVTDWLLIYIKIQRDFNIYVCDWKSHTQTGIHIYIKVKLLYTHIEVCV